MIEDTIVALFDGFSADAGSMAWYCTWRLHLASDRRSRNILLDELEDGRRIYYVPESANYSMEMYRKESLILIGIHLMA